MKKANDAAIPMDIAHLRRDQLDIVDQKDQQENQDLQVLQDFQAMMERMVNQEFQERRVNKDLLVIKDHLGITYTLNAPLQGKRVPLDLKEKREIKDHKDHLDILGQKENLAKIIMVTMENQVNLAIQECLESKENLVILALEEKKERKLMETLVNKILSNLSFC